MIVKSPGLTREQMGSGYGYPLEKVSPYQSPGFGNTMSNPIQYGKSASAAKKGTTRRKVIEKISISPLKVIMFSIFLGIGGYLYITHVFTTQAILIEVNQLKNDYDRARIRHADLKFTYDRMTGPADVYERAKQIGMIDGGPADKIILLK